MPLRIVSQVGLATIGFNCHAIACDIDARPSGSVTDWLQRRGRAQRAFPMPQGDRTYQEDLIGHCRSSLRDKKNPMIVMPCGGGKSYTACKMASLAIAKGHSVGFLTVRRALVKDLSESLDRFGVPNSIIMDGYKDTGHPTKVASVHTVVARDITLKCSLLYVDEAHLALSPELKAVIDRHSHIPRIFMTATPGRTDLQPMSLLADRLVYGPSAEDLIAMGILVPTRLISVGVPDVSKLAIRGTDFSETEMEKLMNRKGLVANVVTSWKKFGEDRPTICHAVNIAHSKNIVERFNAAGIEAVHVDASNSDEEREDVFNRLQRDAPPKKDVILLDMAGNAYCRFGYPEDEREWGVNAGAVSTKPRAAALSLRRCEGCLTAFRSTIGTCPGCGAPHVPTQKQIIERKQELHEIHTRKRMEGRQKWIQSLTVEQKLERLDKIIAKCRTNNYQPAWCLQIYKSTVGEPVPKDWMGRVFRSR